MFEKIGFDVAEGQLIIFQWLGSPCFTARLFFFHNFLLPKSSYEILQFFLVKTEAVE